MRQALIGTTLALSILTGSIATYNPVSDMVVQVHAARGDNLPISGTLMTIAQARANSIVTNFSHAGAGVPGMWWGEILAWNSYPEDLTVAGAITAWLSSAPHRDVLLGQWEGFGIGHAVVNGHHYWAAVFARDAHLTPISTPKPAPPPVAQPPFVKIALPPTSTEEEVK